MHKESAEILRQEDLFRLKVGTDYYRNLLTHPGYGRNTLIFTLPQFKSRSMQVDVVDLTVVT